MSYTKQDFVSGQILKAEHLNNMENGIEANANAVASLSEEIEELKGEQLIFDIQATTEATNPYYTGTILSDYVIKEGNICRVVHNETVYYCVVRQSESGIFIGNRYLKNINMEDTGESFYADVVPNYGIGVFFFQEFGNNNISVSVLTHLPFPEIFVDTTNLAEEIATTVDTKIAELAALEVTLPATDGVVNHGTAGQFAVSDGKGGITWKTLYEAEEVSY